MATTPTAPNATIIPKATVIETLRPSISEAPIKKPEFIDRVVLETGLKKKDVKPVVEAMLDVMARALTSGEDLTIPPLGKLMIKRTKDTGNATIVTIKLRHPTGGGGGGGNGGHKNDPLADELI